MKKNLNIDVSTLDASHRQALEEIIGLGLSEHQKLIVTIVEPPISAEAEQVLQQWEAVFDGLSEVDIEEIDKIANTRAELAREDQ